MPSRGSTHTTSWDSERHTQKKYVHTVRVTSIWSLNTTAHLRIDTTVLHLFLAVMIHRQYYFILLLIQSSSLYFWFCWRLPPPLSARCILLDMSSEGFPLSGQSQWDLPLSPQLEAPKKTKKKTPTWSSAFHSPIKPNTRIILYGWGVHWLQFTSTLNRASHVLTSSPMMVILGKCLDSDAQMLCCASLSASVCRSLAPVCAGRKQTGFKSFPAL